MQQLCPHCFRSVTLPESSAGQDAPCPECGKAFAVPPLYTPDVDPTAARPDLPPKKELPPLPEMAPSAVVPVSDIPPPPPGVNLSALGGAAGAVYGRGHEEAATNVRAAIPETSRELSLNHLRLHWVVPLGASLLLIFTFCTWVGFFPGGQSAYSQSPWEAFFGTMSVDHFAEEILKLETGLRDRLHSNLLFLMPYLFGVLLFTVLAWADRFVLESDLVGLPPKLAFVRDLWPRRSRILAIAAVVLFVLYFLQVRSGLGLETAFHRKVVEETTEKLDKTETSQSRQKTALLVGLELNKFHLDSTLWLNLAGWIHVVTVVAAVGKLWLEDRRGIPAPHVRVTW